MVVISLNLVKTQWRVFSKSYPLTRAIISYAVIWPTGSIIQQAIEGKQPNEYDWARCLRFSIFGGLYVAPTLYGWVKLTSAMWPQMSLRIGLLKAAIEQCSYGPFACASFFFGMSLLEFKTVSEAIEETKDKFLPTYKVGCCVWPVVQTINFSMVPEHNRVIFVSICSLIWTTFLAFMKKNDMATQSFQENTENAELKN